MKCEDVRPLISPLIDDELAVEAVARVSQHLVDCLDCEEERSRLVALRSRLHEYRSALYPPAGFVDRLKEGVESQKKATRRASMLKRWQYLLPLATVAAAVVVYLLPQHQQERTFTQKAHTAYTPPLNAQIFYSYERGVQRSEIKPMEYDPDLAAKLVGFGPEPPKLRGWQLVKTCVVLVESTKGIKYSYSRVDHGQRQSLSCYQFRGGTFDGSQLSQHLIDGRKICCGTSGTISLVSWSKSHKDIVLASQISRADLMNAALSS